MASLPETPEQLDFIQFLLSIPKVELEEFEITRDYPPSANSCDFDEPDYSHLEPALPSANPNPVK